MTNCNSRFHCSKFNTEFLKILIPVEQAINDFSKVVFAGGFRPPSTLPTPSESLSETRALRLPTRSEDHSNQCAF